MMKKLTLGTIVLLLFLVGVFAQKSSENPTVSPSPTPTFSPSTPVALPISTVPSVQGTQDSGLLRVTKVIDGDTIQLETGQTVRYIGIDTPETVDPRRGQQCYGKEASDKNKELVLNKWVRLEKDVSETDRYGRLLRYVYVGDTFINNELVRQGYAYASSYPPDVARQEALRVAEREAREGNRGLWGTCGSGVLPTQPLQAVPTQSVIGSYKCDCGKQCGAIATCDEARYQLQSCGCSARDSDGDGVPCEAICN